MTVDDASARMLALSRQISAQLAGATGATGATTEAAPSPAPEPTAGTPAKGSARPQEHGPRVSVARESGMAGSADAAQREHVAGLISRLTAKTASSKDAAQRYRSVLADSRAVVGFRSATKEMQYPIAGRRAAGSRLEDLDGNAYVDVTMGFGTLLFGHEPAFVTEAVREHLSRGLQLGPRNTETGEAAQLLADITGMDRVAFANSGTEANSAAIRLARNATGRTKIVMFHGSYHGHADNVLGRSVPGDGGRQTVPVSSGIPGSAVADLVVLDYGSPESLRVIDELGPQIAAVMVEPVQSRKPAFQPGEFVRELRALTTRHGIVLLFDEMLTGLRPCPGGAQEFYGVTADLATYGKALGGGFPIGAIAGRADIMDGIDGGFWRYGDASYPPRDTTFFGGTYIQHPVSMVAARAVLTHLLAEGPGLQQRLNARTDAFVGELNGFFTDEEFPLRINHFGSMFRFEHLADMELLYPHLLLKGVLVWEWRNFFLSTAHSDADLAFVTDAVKTSLRELRSGGFFPSAKVQPTGAPRAVTTATATERPAAVCQPAASPVSQRAASPASRPETNGAASPAQDGALDFSVYFFGDYPRETPEEERYDLVVETARFADRHGFHALWLPERHFHSFGGISPNPSVLAAALARETSQIRLNAGSVVLPLHDPIRVAEEWAMVDALSGGRAGLGFAPGWRPDDFVFHPERFGNHRDLMYEQLDEVRRLWRGESVQRACGNGRTTTVQVFPKPVQSEPPMFAAVVGNPVSYGRAARHDLGIVTNLMSQTPEQLADNIVLYRKERAAAGLDPEGGRVVLLLHTYLGPDLAQARRDAFAPLSRYLRSSLSMFGEVTNSLGFNVDLDRMTEDDLDFVFERAYGRYCDQRSLIGTVESCAPLVRRLREIGVDEIAALVDFGVPARGLSASMVELDTLRRTAQSARAGSVVPTPTPTPTAAPRIAERSEPEPVDPVEPVVAPVSAGQQRVWFSEQLLAGRSVYNEAKAIRLRGAVDVDALHAALGGLIRRHESLRTGFREIDGELCQIVRATAELDFAFVDRSGADEETVAREALDEEGRRQFDLAEGPLFVARLIRLAPDAHVMVWSMHHIVMDALSTMVMCRDLSALYTAALDGRPADLPALTASCADLARRQAESGESELARAELDWWVRQLGGRLPEPQLPADRPRPEVMTSRGRAAFTTFDLELTTALKDLSRTHGVTLFTSLLAAFAAMVRQVGTGEDEVVLGTPASVRPEGAEDLVGFLLNPLALRIDLSGDPTFAELLGRVRGVVLDAYDHSDTPFERIVHALALPRRTDRTPVFQVIVEFENEQVFDLDLPGVEASVLEFATSRAVTDLTVNLTNGADGVLCQLEYNTDLFDAATVEGFLAVWRSILRAGSHDPGLRLSELAALRGRDVQTPRTTVRRLVDEQAARRPDAVAVESSQGAVSYGELVARADRIAGALAARGVGSGDVVALWLPRSADLIAAMLAVLGRGAAYLPLDPALGRQRVDVVLAESGARLVLSGSGADAVPAPGIALLDIADALRAGPTAPVEGSADDPCYVIYTSGSTGLPKGVVATHAGVVNLCGWHRARFGFDEARRAAMVCSQSFDASVLEVWPALTAGGTVVVADDADRLDTRALAKWLGDREIEVCIVPTPLGAELLTLGDELQPASLRQLMLGGEEMRRRPRPGLPYEVLNVYGPTEATVLVTTETVADESVEAGPIALGRAIDNTALHVLDEHGRRVAPGVEGELHIGGAGLAQGYLGRPELTAERFVTTEWGRLYRTGDLVRLRPDGRLEFRGRADDQAKIRGYRVEPGEATHALLALEEVADAYVTARHDHQGDAYLVGYVVPRTPSPDVVGRIREQLGGRLPAYLVPTRWVVLDSLPLNANGKIDRSALPDPGQPTPTPPPVVAPAGLAVDRLVERVRELWSAELGQPVGAEAGGSFFDLGGHSINAMRLLNRVRDEFDCDYAMMDFYREPTIEAMVAGLARNTAGPAGDAPEPSRVRGTL
ncbi:MupA/Atu3671 family FMN-dependent luciferase-like monooxygenase [Streptacidiphilus neutrinimicus]|uniref:MupA/Atu3671 family FMN-dependent luciferase-like monooxygenase n=1 Tax=Streptacidiphilus neutrinimicus TaxID=105420 RepID=UPI000A8E1D91|nr:MupA/Atu3671 family FMN-dependent luciferase-like monooxygenase [Streptacidiphilus neutrinimicus]